MVLNPNQQVALTGVILRTWAAKFVATLIDAGKKFNAFVLKNLVSGRHDFAKDHHVRGRWRTFLAVSVVLIPLAIFGAMLWYCRFRHFPSAKTHTRAKITHKNPVLLDIYLIFIIFLC
jgi:hypothetical protein